MKMIEQHSGQILDYDVEEVFSNEQDLGEDAASEPKIRVLSTRFGRVFFYIGDVGRKLSPQITDIEIRPEFRGKGYGERLFLAAVAYLLCNENMMMRIAFKKGGIGTSWDMSHGFWGRMAEKYGGSRAGRRGEWFQGDWGFPPGVLTGYASSCRFVS